MKTMKTYFRDYTRRIAIAAITLLLTAFAVSAQAQIDKCPGIANGEHIFILDYEYTATCTSFGRKIFVCRYCGAAKTELVPALGHLWGDPFGDYVAPTCTTAGGYHHTCQRDGCGVTELDNSVAALGHDWTEWTKTAAATCTTAAVEARNCQRNGCDANETRNVGDPLGHTWGADYNCIRGDAELPAIAYVKADGTAGSHQAIPITGSNTDDVVMGYENGDTWYYLSGSVTLHSLHLIDRTANIILTAGCNNTILGGITIANGSLNIYCQSGTSKLISAINAHDEVNIYGGQLSLSSLSSGGDITLGWTNTNDQFRSTSISADGTITVAEGKALKNVGNHSEVFYGDGTAINAADISRKILQPLTDVSLADNASNATTISKLNGFRNLDITLAGRTLYKDGDWNTLCLPFAVSNFTGTPLEGATVMELDGDKSNLTGGTLTLNFTDATSIEAGKPYIVKWDNTPVLTISSDEDWTTFAANVNNGTEDYAGKLVKLATNINVSTMVGTGSNPFKGIFDGDGHTLTLSISDTENQGTAPFRYISGATIMNVKTTGTVTGNLHCAGLVGFAWSGTNSIKSCEVVASVTCSGGDHSHCGGILGHGKSSNTTITDCLFSGSITGATTATGIIYGWGDTGTHTIENCLAAGTSYTDCGGIELIHSGSTQTITNCYRKTSGGTQGEDASSMSNEALVAELDSGWEIVSGNVVPKKNNTVVLSDITNPVFSGVTVSSTEPTAITFEGGCFVGNYSPFSVVASGATKPDEGNINEIIFLGADSQLGYAAEPRTLRPFRAHFEVTSGQNVKGYRISFGEEDPTAIENSKLINSNFKNSDTWFSLDGIKLQGKPTRKGIYIHNGKRIVVK